MMIDEVTLSGPPAYLRKGDGTAVLGPGDTGITGGVGRGEIINVDAVDIYLEVRDALKLFVCANQPLLSLELKKEMFPGLYLDPNAHRIYQLAGDEDFRRAVTSNMLIMEIEGVPTLVSPGQYSACKWISARYPLPRPTSVTAVAWTLALTRGVPEEAFKYKLDLIYWLSSDPGLSDAGAQRITLTSGSKPADPRHKVLSDQIEMVGYQFAFEAEVYYDAQLQERHGALENAQSVGTPLLQALFLLEARPRTYDMHSLQELVAQASSYQLLNPTAPLTQIIARVHFPAALTEGEALSLRVHSSDIQRCEARLDATVRTRPSEPKFRI
jgi:hypothetical protein